MAAKVARSRAETKSQLVQAWRMGNEANLYLLGQLPDAYLEGRYAARTRTVAGQFAHMHNVRVRWLEHAAPKLLGDLRSFPRGAQPGKKELTTALKESSGPIAEWLEQCETAGKVSHWNGPPATLLGYLIAHEAHHRGLAMVALRVCGRKLPQEVVHGQWRWGKEAMKARISTAAGAGPGLP